MKERKKLNNFRGEHDVLRNLTNTRVRRLYQTFFYKMHAITPQCARYSELDKPERRSRSRLQGRMNIYLCQPPSILRESKLSLCTVHICLLSFSYYITSG